MLSIEWLKLRRYRTFWVLTGFFLVLFPLFNYVVWNGMMEVGSTGGKEAPIKLLSRAYSFPEVWGNLGFWGSIFVLFLSILVIILATNEWSFRTARQAVIDGRTKLEMLHAKMALILAISLATTLYLVLVGLAFGFATGGAAGIGYGWEEVGYFFLLTLNYLLVALFLANLTKRSGLAIGAFLLYAFILENILRGILNYALPFPAGNFLPLQAADELLPFPFLKTARSMMGQESSIAPGTYAIVTLGWSTAAYFANRWLLLRRDW